MKCSVCGFEVPLDMNFCGMCGTRQGRECPTCGFVSPSHFAFCGNCGARLLPPAQPAPQPVHLPEPISDPPPAPTPQIIKEGERRIATVLVTDLTGSTHLLEKMGTEAWVTMMNRILHILEGEIYRFGGKVHQFRGDGLVAFFGASTAHEDDPERSVLAGLSMQRAFQSYAQEMQQQSGFELKLRVGISTGEVIVTNLTGRYLAGAEVTQGHAVVVAGLMESSAEPGTVLVSEDTYRLTQKYFGWLEMQPAGGKGIPQPVATYRPLTTRIPNAALPNIASYNPPIVGRENELNTILNRITRLFEAHGGIVTLSGEKGMGKSFIANEVMHFFERQKSLRTKACEGQRTNSNSLDWYQVRCHSYDQIVPYSLWIELLLNWLGKTSDDQPEEISTQLKQECEALWGDEAKEYFPYLARFLSLPIEDAYLEKVKYLEAEPLRQQFFATLRKWIEALAHRAPTVLVLADLHWADPSALELLKYCLPVCENESLLWLISYRPERTAPIWELRHYLETQYPHRLLAIQLNPLSDTEAGQFIDGLVGKRALTGEARKLILKNAEGNPYYIQELVQSLVTRGVLIQDVTKATWHTTRPITSIDLPDSLHNLLLAQIDRLPHEERFVLQMASIIGDEFWSNVLEKVVPAEIDLKNCLISLQRKGFFIERGEVPEIGRQYSFKSNLLQDVAYDTLLSEQKIAAHQKVAEFLENTLNLDFFSQHFGLLAYHYAQARRPNKELFYTLQFAQQTKRVFANEEALRLYNRALELLSQIEVSASNMQHLQAIRANRFEVLRERIDIYQLLGQSKPLQEDAQALLTLAEQLSDDPVFRIDAILAQPGIIFCTTSEQYQACLDIDRRSAAPFSKHWRFAA
ncbi:MAG: AAA family ATPase [Clostridiaceae bacterium]